MPTSTFFNLPVEKREKLIRAAWEEFGRTSYPESSINKIVQAADIPRGSFYQYFADKGDLFRFLLKDFLEELTLALEETLKRHSGDLFAALPEYFDQILADHGKYSATREALRGVFQKNPQLGPELLPGPESRSAFLEHIRTAVDRSRLDLQGERDLDYIIETLTGITGKLLARAIIGQDPASVRREYHDILSILRRGMEKRPGEAARAE